MKNLWMLLLLCLAFSGCKDKAVDPETYDGEYPYYKNNGEKIKIYDNPKLMGSTWNSPMEGTCTLSFNNHPWNHWPAISGHSGRLRTGSMCQINFFALSGFACTQENLSFTIPANVGLFRHGKQDAKFSYYNEDCDVAKDHIEVNQEANNWVKITRYDSLSRPNEAEGSFDITFRVISKKLIYPLVYPNTIRMRGSFKQKLIVP